jgi:RND family efflux transporter MFP subunit
MHRSALIIFVALAAAACRRDGDGKAELPPATGPAAPPAPALPKVEPIAAAGGDAGSAGDSLTTGTLFPHAEAQLAPNASGLIARILVDEGTRVKKGDVLFRLDATDASLRRDQAQAALAAAKVNLKATKVEYDRTKAMLDENAVNRSQWDAIEARYDAAAVGVRQAEVAVNMADKAVADTTVRSPLDGVVVAKLKNEGEMATMMPPTIVLVVQDQATLDLRFRLPAHALTTIKTGDTVTAKLQSLGLTRTAKIARVNPTVDVRTRTVEVVAELDNKDLTLKPGLLAEVQL